MVAQSGIGCHEFHSSGRGRDRRFVLHLQERSDPARHSLCRVQPGTGPCYQVVRKGPGNSKTKQPLV